MQLIKKILFPTDFGESMDVALKSVIDIAKKFNSEIILLHVLPENISTERLKDLVSEKMKEFRDKIKAEQIKCYYELISGNSADVIIDFAERKGVNIILLGAGRSSKMEFKLGSNSEKIIRNSSIPVWIIEKDKPVSINTILCPVDFSDASRLALDNAIHLCRRYESKLIVMHVIKSLGDEYADIGIDTYLEQPEWIKRISAEFDSFLMEVNPSGISWKKELKLGVPSNEIIKYISTDDVGLVMLGSTGKSGLKRFFIGSVAEKVMRKVPCSFIVIKSESLINLDLEKGLTDIDSLFQEGVQLEKDGYTDEAIATWKRCTSKNEYYLKAWGAIAAVYESLGDEKNAKHYTDIRNRIQRSIWDTQIEADLRGKHRLFK
ncbi:MAG: universal stress protein [Flavobacteriales bacterium]|nr:universal stress protein [Flavobacteriales bacterium]